MQNLSMRSFVLLLLVLGMLAMFLELGRMHVYTANEGQRAAPPAEMLQRGDFVVPTLNGKPYLAKPPLLYWTIAGMYKVTGKVEPLLARIPVAIIGLMLVLCMYFIYRRFTTEAVARWSALAMLATPYFLERARWAELDVPLVFATFLCICALYASWRNEAWGKKLFLALLAGLALAAATMLKGPPPYLFVLGAWMAYLLAEGDPFETRLGAGFRWTLFCMALGFVLWPFNVGFPYALALFIAGWLCLSFKAGRALMLPTLVPLLIALVLAMGLCVPWAYMVVERLGWGNIQALLDSEVVERTHTATAINSGTPLYFIIALPFMLAPFGLLLPLQAVRQFWERGDSFYRFSLLAGWLSVLIFSLIAGKEYEYILPIVPFLLVPTAQLVAWAETGTLAGMAKAYEFWWRKIILAILSLGLFAVLVAGVLGHGASLLNVWLLLLLLAGLMVRFGVIPPFGESQYLRIAGMAIFVILGVLLVRAYDHSGEDTDKRLGKLCGELVREGYTVEASKIYPWFTFYAASPIQEALDIKAISASMKGDTPYFYLTRDSLYEMMQGDALPGVEALTEAYGSKDLMLIGNPAAKKALLENYGGNDLVLK